MDKDVLCSSNPLILLNFGVCKPTDAIDIHWHQAIYDETGFQMINGRNIRMEYEIGGSGLAISADPEEKVFGLYFTDDNSCKIPPGKEKEVCKIGEGTDCCIFLSAGSKGFACEKFDSFIARNVLDRLAKGTINAKRIGNCALLGRKEN